MGDFAPVVVRRQSVLAPARATREEKKWGSYKCLVKEKMEMAVTGVAFSPRLPYEMAAASDMSVSLINSTIGEVRRTIGRFKDTAHSPDFKPDGRLLVAGSDNGVVQLFQLASRSILRQFKGHTGAVWSSMFTADGLRVMSGSDDSTVRLWDLASEKSLRTFDDAKDYVRAQAPSPAAKHIWMAGSYDRQARIYDVRKKDAIVCELDHGSQVDDVAILPGGLRAVTVGGTCLKVWDLLSGRLEYRVSNHAKAVTSVVVHPDNDRLLTAGLDGQVKVLSLASFKVCAAMYYQGAIISLGISPDGKRIGTGTMEGVAEIRVAKAFTHDLPYAPPDGGLKEKPFEGWGGGFAKENQRTGPRAGTRRYFNRGAFSKPADDDVVVVAPKYAETKLLYDRYLRSFSYGLALGAAAKTRDPAILVSVVEELASRRGLRNAVTSCSEEGLLDALRITVKNIDLPQFTGRLTDFVNIVLDVREADIGSSEVFMELVNRILVKVRDEVNVGKELQELEGLMDCALHIANVM